MRLLIVRHGQTDSNADGRSVADTDGLSVTGKAQVEYLAERLATEPIDVALYSGSLRSEQTLAAIVQRRPDMPARLYPELHEGLMGEWSREPVHVRAAEAARLGIPIWEVRPPGGESWVDISERVGHHLEMIYHRYKGENVLIVGHGRINSLTIRLLENVPWKNYSGMQQPHVSLSILRWSFGGSVAVEIREDNSFLPEPLRTI